MTRPTATLRPEDVLTESEAAALLHVMPDTLRQWCGTSRIYAGGCGDGRPD